MIWARMPSGKANPLNVAHTDPTRGNGMAAPRVIAYNPETQGGMPVTGTNLQQMLRWEGEGRVTFHTSHFSDCPERGRFKRDG